MVQYVELVNLVPGDFFIVGSQGNRVDPYFVLSRRFFKNHVDLICVSRLGLHKWRHRRMSVFKVKL